MASFASLLNSYKKEYEESCIQGASQTCDATSDRATGYIADAAPQGVLVVTEDMLSRKQELADFAAAKNITSVHLHGKRLAIVPEEFTSMVWLRELNLSWNLLKSLPAALCLLTQLRDLELSDNCLTSVPESVGALQNLTCLHLHSNSLKSVPAELFNLTGLRKLSLHTNELTSLPDTTGSFQELTWLSLNNNMLESVPACWYRNVDASAIGLSMMHCVSICSPNSGAQCLSLCYMCCISCLSNVDQKKPCSTFSSTRLCRCPKLVRVCFHINNLTEIPESVNMLKAVQAATWHRNSLKALPREIGHMQSVCELALFRNELVSLPDEFCNLSSMTELWLYDNKLQALPDAFGNLSSLRKLWLGNNCLKELPDSLCNILNLKQIYIEDNELTGLPAGLEALPLEVFRVQNNPFVFPVPEWVLRLQTQVKSVPDSQM